MHVVNLRAVVSPTTKKISAWVFIALLMSGNLLYPLFAVASSNTAMAGAGSNNSSIGSLAWTNPDNVVIDDSTNARATALVVGETITQYLLATNFGFSLPLDAIINGIMITINRSATSNNAANYVIDNEIRLVSDGLLIGTNNSSLSRWKTAAATLALYGGAQDNWSADLTAAEINNNNFGVALAALISVATSTVTARVDYVEATVNYSQPSTLEIIPTSPSASYGSPTTIHAKITGLGPVATGTVTISEGDNTLDVVEIDIFGEIVYRLATTTPVGDHEVTLTYNGNSDYTGSINTVYQSITPLDIYVSAVYDSKIYDGTMNSTVTPILSPSLVEPDTSSFAQVYDTKDAGIGNTLDITGTINGEASNYNFIYIATTGDILPIVINPTGATVASKIYDANMEATIEDTAPLDGIINDDDVALDFSRATIAFSDKNVGANKLVTITGLTLYGVEPMNYLLATDTITTTANIYKTDLTVSAIIPNAKIYDGTTTAAVNYGLDGLYPGDEVIINSTANFSTPDVGVNIDVTANDFFIAGGADKDNYTLITPGELVAQANITQYSAQVVFDTPNLILTYDGTLKSIGKISTDPANLEYVELYNGTTTKPLTANTYAVSASINDINFAGATTTTLIIKKKVVEVRANNVEWEFGSPEPNYTYDYIGLVAGEGSSTINSPICAPIGTHSNLGSYEIICNNALAANYEFTFSTGTLIVIDTTAPTLTLNGLASTTLEYGSTYVERGATWHDAHDGSGAAVIAGDIVNTTVAGEYIVVYNQVDTSGNMAAQISRLVSVKQAPSSGSSWLPLQITSNNINSGTTTVASSSIINAPTSSRPTINSITKPQQLVLGEKIYKDGTLVRSKDKKIYVFVKGRKVHIKSLTEIRKYYRGKAIINILS